MTINTLSDPKTTLDDGFGNTVSGIAGRAHQTIDEATDKARPAVDRAAAAAHRTVDKLADSAVPAADWAAEHSRKLVTRSTEIADSCSGYVRARPFVSLAGALAVGYLIGRMAR
ncbi:MAG: hypothetical protein IT521_05000 [Burkholderiales bacterium]|nr:hypothetical protein [Burkholderiales bacterium]